MFALELRILNFALVWEFGFWISDLFRWFGSWISSFVWRARLERVHYDLVQC